MGRKRNFVRDSVSAPTEYDLVQKRQYTGQTEDANQSLLDKTFQKTLHRELGIYQEKELYPGICGPSPELGSLEPRSKSRGLI